MKILKEAKENLPIAFLTSFISDGWEKVGILKEEIEAINKEFKGTKKVEELIQALIDAYLVCIGQMEQHLADKDYLDIDDKEEVKESLKESLSLSELTNEELIQKYKDGLAEYNRLCAHFDNIGWQHEDGDTGACYDYKVAAYEKELKARGIDMESLTENVDININKVIINNPEITDVEVEHETTESPTKVTELDNEKISSDENDEQAKESASEKLEEIEEACKKDLSEGNEKFEYFVDNFPEPLPSEDLEK